MHSLIHKVMEVAEDSQVLDSQPMRSDDEAASDPPFGPQDAEQMILRS